MDNALGLIEVIGYVTAIEATDSALKAASVKLIGVTKVDGGIVTVQVAGDVGAVKSAVEAGGLAAERIGELRATHMIPRLDPSVARMLGHGVNPPEKEMLDLVPTVLEEPNATETIEESTGDLLSEVVPMDRPNGDKSVQDEVDLVQRIRPEDVKRFTKEELEKISNQELKQLMGELGIKVSPKKLKGAKKADLIHLIIQFGKEGGANGNN